jgi:hypothetical protein
VIVAVIVEVKRKEKVKGRVQIMERWMVINL